jgi:hypothetical protein
MHADKERSYTCPRLVLSMVVHGDTMGSDKSHLCIPSLGIARPQSQFPHSCVCGRFIYSPDWSTYFLQQNSQIDGGNI